MSREDTSTTSLGAMSECDDATKQAAARTAARDVAAHGGDAAELAELLAMLGIVPTKGAQVTDPWGSISSGRRSRLVTKQRTEGTS